MIGLILAMASGALMLLTLGLDIEASNDGFTVFAFCGPWSFRLYPWEMKAKKESRKKDKKKSDKQAEDSGELEKAPKKKITSSLIKKMLRAAINTLKRFVHALQFDLIEFHYTAAAADVSDTAIQYGYVNAILSALYPIFDNSVRRLDIRTGLDYDMIKPKVYTHIILSLAIWEILYISLAFVTDMLNMLYQDR